MLRIGEIAPPARGLGDPWPDVDPADALDRDLDRIDRVDRLLEALGRPAADLDPRQRVGLQRQRHLGRARIERRPAVLRLPHQPAKVLQARAATLLLGALGLEPRQLALLPGERRLARRGLAGRPRRQPPPPPRSASSPPPARRSARRDRRPASPPAPAPGGRSPRPPAASRTRAVSVIRPSRCSRAAASAAGSFLAGLLGGQELLEGPLLLIEPGEVLLQLRARCSRAGDLVAQLGKLALECLIAALRLAAPVDQLEQSRLDRRAQRRARARRRSPGRARHRGRTAGSRAPPPNAGRSNERPCATHSTPQMSPSLRRPA